MKFWPANCKFKNPRNEFYDFPQNSQNPSSTASFTEEHNFPQNGERKQYPLQNENQDLFGEYFVK